MSVKVIQCFIFLLGFLFSSGTFAKDFEDQNHRLLSSHPAFHLQISNFNDEVLIKKPSPHRLLIPVSGPAESLDTMPQLDVTTSMATVPTINPSTPTTTTPTYSNPTPAYTDLTPTYSNPTSTVPTPIYSNPTPMRTPVTTPTTTPYTTPTTTPSPTMGTPSTSSGQSWCIASQSASQTALKVALDYACGYGGSDCTAIQQGGSCFNPDTLRDHASYAFNSYYQKNPVSTSCDFGGTAMTTNTDPSTSTCRYPSASTSSSTPTTSMTSPTSPTGPSPPDYDGTDGTISMSISMSSSFSLMILLLSFVCIKVYE